MWGMMWGWMRSVAARKSALSDKIFDHVWIVFCRLSFLKH